MMIESKPTSLLEVKARLRAYNRIEEAVAGTWLELRGKPESHSTFQIAEYVNGEAWLRMTVRGSHSEDNWKTFASMMRSQGKVPASPGAQEFLRALRADLDQWGMANFLSPEIAVEAF